MIDVGLFDGSFMGKNSATFGGDNLNDPPAKPEHITYKRDTVLPVTFYTDMCLENIFKIPNRARKVAMLVEPPSLSDSHYYKAIRWEDEFDYILYFNRDLHVATRPSAKWKYYPLGGSWIRQEDWGVFDKTKRISLFVSEKRRAPGHILRSQASRHADLHGIDVYGRGYNPVVSKIEGLRDYRYSIVIESIRCAGYFSEKLIDCISQGTIPIYWGARDIDQIFDMDGIITFNTIEELVNIIVNQLSDEDYKSRISAVRSNFITATNYTCAEDWIYEEYPEIFA